MTIGTRTQLAVIARLVWFEWLVIGFGEQTDQPAVCTEGRLRIVLAKLPNVLILKLKLETRESRFVYEVRMVTTEGQKKELCFNAENGRFEKASAIQLHQS